MNARKIGIFKIATDRENHVIKVDLSYSKGGMSFWDYKTYPEGFYLNVQPVEEKPGDGYTTETYEAGSGFKTFIEAGKRFSAKRLRDLATKARETKGESLPNFSDILKKICERDGFSYDKIVI